MEIERTIPSGEDMKALQAVQEEIVAAAEEQGFEGRDIFGIRLALEEALVNANRHGNQCNPEKSVTVIALVTAQKVNVMIVDQGAGFVPAEVPDCTEEENLEKASGRGLMLMKAYMDTVEYSPKGNQVTIEKQKSSVESQVA